MVDVSVATSPLLGLPDDVFDLVAAWLPDATPLAATAQFARCAAHFRSYLVASANLAAFRCFACGDEVRCAVRSHWHVSPGFIVYEGATEEDWYAWSPTVDRAACGACTRRLGFDVHAWWAEVWRSRSDDEFEDLADEFLDMFAATEF